MTSLGSLGLTCMSMFNLCPSCGGSLHTSLNRTLPNSRLAETSVEADLCLSISDDVNYAVENKNASCTCQLFHLQMWYKIYNILWLISFLFFSLCVYIYACLPPPFLAFSLFLSFLLCSHGRMCILVYFSLIVRVNVCVCECVCVCVCVYKGESSFVYSYCDLL